MNPNQLAQWLNFYDKNLKGSVPQPFFAGGAWNSPGGEQRTGLLWAEKMAAQEGQDRQAPDFFSNQPGRMSGGGPGDERKLPAYVSPQQFAPQQPTQYGQGPSGQPLGQEMNAYAGERPLPSGEGQMRPDVMNYLAKLLGGRGRYGY